MSRDEEMVARMLRSQPLHNRHDDGRQCQVTVQEAFVHLDIVINIPTRREVSRDHLQIGYEVVRVFCAPKREDDPLVRIADTNIAVCVRLLVVPARVVRVRTSPYEPVRAPAPTTDERKPSKCSAM